MRALRVGGLGALRLEEAAEPDPDTGALVRVKATGLCGTDLKILSGAIPVAPGRVLGHEAVGTVVRGGDTVPDGTRVLVDPSIACGRCAVCLADGEHLCPDGGLLGRDLDGTFADLVSVPPSRLHPLPAGLPDAEAVLLQVLGTCVHAQRRVEVDPGDAAVVLGLGVSGLLHLQLLRARGAHPILTSTRSPWKRELALALGADVVVHPDDLEAAAARLPRAGADVVVECVGNEQMLRLAVLSAAFGGTVLLFGTTAPSADRVPTYRLYHREINVINSRAAQGRDYDEAIRLAESGVVELAQLVTGRFPLDQPAAALAGCADPAQLKVIFEVANHLDGGAGRRLR